MMIHRWFGIAVACLSPIAVANTPATTPSSQAYGSGVFGQPQGDFRSIYQSSSYSDYGPAVFGPLDWPAAEVREVALARARTVIARYEEMRARDLLGDHINRLNRRFSSSPELTSAQQAEDEAWAEYQSAVAAVMGRLRDDPEYRANVELAAEVGSKLEDARDQLDFGAVPISVVRGRPVEPVVRALAENKLIFARRASEMRSAAMSADPAVAEARARLQSASNKVRQLRAEFADSVRDNATVLAMRAQITEARIAHLAAAAYEDSARFIRRLALNYAYYLHRSDASPYYGTYNAPGSGIFPYDGGYYGGAVPVGGYGFRRR